MKRTFAGLLALLVVSGLSGAAHAQEPMRPLEDFAKRVRSAEMVGTLDSSLFGDSVSLYNGATEFSIVDIDLPGNSGLPVQLRRRFNVESRKERGQLGGFGLWDLDVPYLYGTFSTDFKWNQGGSAGHLDHRCSQPWYPRVPSPLNTREIWSGTHMRMPGLGDREILHLSTTGHVVPSSGGPHTWATRDDFRFSCKSTTANGYPGEGFIAVDSVGTKYTFDVGVERLANPIEKGHQFFGRVKIYLLASRVEDRHGNWVRYNYSGDRLTSITSSDGRAIHLAYSNNRIVRATAHGREWTYHYGSGPGYPAGNGLVRVVRPDASEWTYQYSGALHPSYAMHDVPPDGWCVEGPPTGDSFKLTATHPSGARGVFDFSYWRHGRSGVPRIACVADADGAYSLQIANFFDLYSLTSKTIDGPGVPAQQWTYGYPYGAGALTTSPVPCATCAQSKATVVTNPDGSSQVHRFGVLYSLNDGRLLEVETRSPTGVVLRRQTHHYVTEAEAPSMPFPDLIGVNAGTYDPSSMRLRPIKETTVVQQDVTFRSTVNTFDAMARPLNTTKSSTVAGNPTRTEVVQYHDNLARWVIGQQARLTVNGTVASETAYHATSALPTQVKQFGRVVQGLTYNADGTLATVRDGNNHVTTLSNWKRGIPQAIGYPPTPEAPSGAGQSAVVNDHGWITRITDENGFQSNYEYDAMGRLSQLSHPAGDSVAWNPTTFTLAKAASSAYGIPAGHWRHTVATGNGRKVSYLDALWRPLLVREYDTGNASATQRFTRQAFDHEGRTTFASYPSSDGTPATGTWTEYDALGRPTSVSQDSELGVLTTLSQYLAGFQTLVTSPKGHQTTTRYLAWDQPVTDYPVAVSHPAGAFTDIDRDVFGKPIALTRRNGNGSVALTRSYVYDAHHQLCKSVEPETGATIMAYDGAGNLAWSTTGAAQTGTGSCNTADVPVVQRTVRSYDARNRIVSLVFPDNLGNTSYSYEPDGLLSQITVDNGGADIVSTAYTYNRRRLPVGEALAVGSHAWGIGYGYNANGHLTAHSLPGGLTVNYAPNALGQPTQAGAHASGVSHFPNGAIRQFTYGNGIVHTLTQNARGLPDRSRDAYGGTAFHDDGMDYDGHGNVAAISDGLPGHRGDRSMTYDALDRLTGTISPMFGTASYGYDELDNLRTVQLTAGTRLRDHTYIYDAGNRLSLVTATSGGATVASLAYDDQGNLASRNGQAYDFDHGNRLREVAGMERYLYDGHGRRVKAIRNGASIYSVYGQDGVLRYQHDERTGKATEYVYLGGSLVAGLDDAIPLATPALTVPGYSATGNYSASWTVAALATKYQLQERVNGGNWSTVHDAVGTSRSFSGKASGSYGYRVRACDAATCGEWSAIAEVTVQLPPTSAPTLTVPAMGLHGNYIVSWSSVPAADRYELQERGGGGSWGTTVVDDGTSLPISGRAAGDWDYRVRGCNDAGCGPYSAVGTVESVHLPTGVPALTAPASNLTGSYAVSWGSVATATRYELEERLGSGSWSRVHEGSGTSWSASNRQTGTWGYRVRACNGAGCAGYSPVRSTAVTRPPTSAPTVSVPANNTSGSYTVSWSQVSPVTHYQLQERLGSGSWSQVSGVSGTSKAISGRATGTWSYRARGCNDAGCGDYSQAASVAVLRIPAVPQITYAHRHTFYQGSSVFTSCRVTWSASPHADSYGLQAYQGASLYNGPETSVASPPYTARYCAPSYIVRACNASGCSAWSSPPYVASVTEDPPPPGWPGDPGDPGDPPVVPRGAGEGEGR